MQKLIAGAALGIVLFGGARLAFAPLNKTTHHHANWAVTVNGEALDLSLDRYMQEIGACTASDAGILPEERIHMHENDGGLVHVHHPGATWGALAANLGFGLGDSYLFLDTGERYENGPEGRLVFIINGFEVPSIHNRVVQSEDRLLIAYTTERAAALQDTQFAAVRSDAAEYNARMDPATCSGGHGDLPFMERLKLAFWG